MFLVLDLLPAGFAQHLIEQAVAQSEAVIDRALAQADVGDGGVLGVIEGAQGRAQQRVVAHAAHLPRRRAHRVQHGAGQPVARVQRSQPRRGGDAHLGERELEQHAFQQGVYVLFAHVERIHGHHRHAVLLFQTLAQAAGVGLLRVRGVEQHHEGLFQRLQFPDDALLGLEVGGAGDVGDAAVGEYHHADGGMLADDLAGADLRRLLKGDVVVEPGRAHHARLPVLVKAQYAVDEIAHAVHQPHAEVGLVAQLYLHGLVGHEFRLGGHDRPARAALGQFVLRPLAAMLAGQVRKHKQLHEALDER